MLLGLHIRTRERAPEHEVGAPERDNFGWDLAIYVDVDVLTCVVQFLTGFDHICGCGQLCGHMWMWLHNCGCGAFCVGHDTNTLKVM